MGSCSESMIQELRDLINNEDEKLRSSFKNIHQGYPDETLVRFLIARDWDLHRAHKMLLDCLKWRIENEIDQILSKPIVPPELYRAVRDSQLYGVSGYTKEGIPVLPVGVGLSTFDKASVHYYVQSHIQMNEYRDRVLLPAASKTYGKYIGTCIKVLDMTGLKISALSQIKLLTTVSTIDDLNYPEKTDTYYIVNAPYVFSACYKVVKPLLQERTRNKIKLLQGSGREELLKVMDESSLPHFCRKEGSGSGAGNCYSLDHPFHQDVYKYIRAEARKARPAKLEKEGSFHVGVPSPDVKQSEIAHTIECELHRLEDQKLNKAINGIVISRD